MKEEKTNGKRKMTDGRNDDKEMDPGFEEDDETSYGPYASFDQTTPDGVFLENQYKTTQLIVKKTSGKTITRLKKPRDLYALSRHFSAQMNQRWPSEVTVISKKPNHIHYTPAKPEILYKPVKDTKPLPRTSNVLGKVVYDNSPDLNIKYFTRSKCGGHSMPAKTNYRLQGPDDKTLIFESRFESGNLMRAIKVADYEYELWLRFDLYTNKHTQWYYFMIQNAQPGIQYRFTIMNFVKAGSLYNDGLRPLMYSESDAQTKGVGWIRTGTKIRYYRNDIKFVDGAKERYYYSLSWTCTFPNENDTYYFAHCYPYTYSDLQDYLAMLASDPVRSRCCKQRILCRTLAGNHVYVLTITAPTKRRNEAEIKKAIVLTARVHPGETNSSWMMKGFLDYLTSNAQDAKILRENFIFKIVPMLNPDGVVVGNYRCSLAGRDLNRNYKSVLKDSFPSIWHTRAMIRKLQEEREILMYCDLHGHSKKKNIFIYGCENRRDKDKRFWGRVFPAMLSKNAPDKFSLNHCRFKVQKNREGTGRIFMWNFGIANSFTMEASFCGSSLGNKKGYHFSVADYESMAYQFCDTLLDFCDPDQSKFYHILTEIEGFIKRAILERLGTNDVSVNDYIDIEQSLYLLSDIESDSGGSDSSVSDGLPMQLLHASVPELSRKKRLRTRKERNRNFGQNSNSKIFNTNNQTEKTAMSGLKSSNNVKTDRKSNDQGTSTPSKGRICYTQRGWPSSGRTVPHFVKDRVVEKSKLKKEYLNMLTSSFVSSGADGQVDLQEIPHCRFTAGISGLYQGHKSCATCERCCRSLSEGSDEEFNNNNFESRTNEQLSVPEVYGHLYGSEQNANTVLDLARRITVYNHRLNQSVPRRREVNVITPNQLRSLWQHRVKNQYEDHELSVTSSESKHSCQGTKSSVKPDASHRRHFEIRQERRAPGDGTYSPRRVNKHFEIKKTKSSSSDSVKFNETKIFNVSEHLMHPNSGNTTGFPGPNRLPHLKRMEECDPASSTTEEKQFTNALKIPVHTNSTTKPVVNRSLPLDETSSTGPTVEELRFKVDRNEVSMLKDKMMSHGATGLVSYMLADNHNKDNFFKEQTLSSQIKEDPFLTRPPSFLDKQSQSFPEKDDSCKAENTRSASEGKFTLNLNDSDINASQITGRILESQEDERFTSFLRGNSDIHIASNKVKQFLIKQENGFDDQGHKFVRSMTNDDILRQGSTQSNAKPLLLDFKGKEAASKPSFQRTRTNKVNPPQLRGLRKLSKDPTQ